MILTTLFDKTTWCEFYQLYEKHPDLWISDLKYGKSVKK